MKCYTLYSQYINILVSQLQLSDGIRYNQWSKFRSEAYTLNGFGELSLAWKPTVTLGNRPPTLALSSALK